MRILVKLGSSLINKGNRLNMDLLSSKTSEFARLFRQGHELIIVSSGAVACGMEIEGLKERPKDAFKLQLLSGEGQILLMKNYKELFDKEGIRIAQILLTHHNFDTASENSTLVRIINAYLEQKTVPIINENDLINKEEFEGNFIFSDNDILAAIVAKNLEVDLAIILTDVHGLFDSDPKRDGKPKLVEEVTQIDDSVLKMASKETNSVGKGGMYSKVVAAQMLVPEGIDLIVANGNLDLIDVIEGKVSRTIFRGKNRNI